jgi:hypothetical protein
MHAYLCATYLLLFTGLSVSQPKRARAKFVRDREGNIIDPSLGRRRDAQDARVAVAAKMQRLEEMRKKSLFVNVSNLKKLSKQEYWEFHRQLFYSLPRDITSTYFYRSEHERIYQ